MLWIGEVIFAQILGIRGMKCIIELMRRELNILRINQGLPEYTLPEFLNHLGTLMEEFKDQDIPD